MDISNLTYVEYTAGIEEIQPDEEKFARETVESMARMNEKTFQNTATPSAMHTPSPMLF